jgi:membrane protease YdiL (CAAX protease family)
MVATKASLKKRIFFSILVPPLAFAPIGIPLFLFGVDVSILRDAWYLSIFISCVILAIRSNTSLSEIGLSTEKSGSSLFLSTAWELATYILLGILPYSMRTGRLPIQVPFNETMAYSAFHFLLVGLAEETWMRGLLLKRLREWRPKGAAPVIWSSIIFVLLHVPAASFIIIQDMSLLPLLALSWLTLFVWAAGLALIVLKTGNLLGPIIVHWLDDFVSKALYI